MGFSSYLKGENGQIWVKMRVLRGAKRSKMGSQIGSKRAPQKDGVLKGSEAKDPKTGPKDPKKTPKMGF
jgi:hypothetical protein